MLVLDYCGVVVIEGGRWEIFLKILVGLICFWGWLVIFGDIFGCNKVEEGGVICI